METIRLTTAGAIVRYLIAQRTEVDGNEVPLFPGVFAIFGHGNVTCLGEALEAVQDQLPTWRGHHERIDGDGGGRVREGEAAAPDHGRHELDRAGGAEHGHRGRHRACEPPPRAPAVRRYVREPRAGPRAPAGGAVRRSDRHGERRLPAGDPLLGPDRAPGAGAPVPPPGRRDDARPRGVRTRLPRTAAGRPGGGLRLPGGVLRASGAPDPAARTRPDGARGGGARCSGRRSDHS